MQIGSIFNNALAGVRGTSPLGTNEENNNESSFEDILNAALKEVNDKQVKAYDSMHDIASGKVSNLQEAVMKIEEAELSLKLALEVKNKAINAYKEVMRMQV